MKSILIVENEYTLRQTLSLILHRAGYQVFSAVEPWQALPLLDQNRYDLLFIDLHSSRSDLPRLIVEIRQRNPGMPILLLTSNVNLSHSEHGVTTLSKPADPELVLSAVKDQIGL